MPRQDRPTKRNRSYIQAWVDRPTHQQFRACLALDGKTIQEWVEEKIEKYLASRRARPK